MKNPQIIEKTVLVVIVSIAASECFALFFCLSRKIIKKMRSQRTRNASCIGDGRASDSTKRSARAGWGGDRGDSIQRNGDARSSALYPMKWREKRFRRNSASRALLHPRTRISAPGVDSIFLVRTKKL